MMSEDDKFEENYKNFLKSCHESAITFEGSFKNYFKKENIGKVSRKFNITKNSTPGSKHDPVGNYDWVYLMQDKIAAQITAGIRSCPVYKEFFIKSIDEGRDSLLDVGSKFHTANLISSMFAHTTYYIELSRNINLSHLNLFVVAAEAQKLPFGDGVIPFATSLHAIEHFGLGRYGDDIDYYGDIKGIKEISRVLMPGGFFITSVPVTAGPSRIDYHTERVYNHKDFDDIMTSCGFEKVKEKSVLGSLRYASKKEEKHGLLDKDGNFLDRSEAASFIIPFSDIRVEWKVDLLEKAEKLDPPVKHSAYISAWRKK